MTGAEIADWLEGATYEELYRKWSASKTGAACFQGEVGVAFAAEMKKKRALISWTEEQEIHKRVGQEMAAEGTNLKL